MWITSRSIRRLCKSSAEPSHGRGRATTRFEGIDVVPDEDEATGHPSEHVRTLVSRPTHFTFLNILFGGILILLGLTLWQAVLVEWSSGTLFLDRGRDTSIPDPNQERAH
jgi:hypothetical protein